MKNRIVIISIIMLLTGSMAFAQLGIRAGVNMANEIHSFDHKDISAAFDHSNLTGYQIGLVYQFNPISSGLGFEAGVLLSQKGGIFRFDSTGVVNSLVKGYKEINYIEVPISLRGRLNLGSVIGVYGTAGIYGAYALKGKTVFESNANLSVVQDFNKFSERIDYGYSLGAGVELIRKLQIGFNWNQGLQKRDMDKSIIDLINNQPGRGDFLDIKAKKTSRVFSVALTYLF